VTQLQKQRDNHQVSDRQTIGPVWPHDYHNWQQCERRTNKAEREQI
jgi:hypothetical protein